MCYLGCGQVPTRYQNAGLGLVERIPSRWSAVKKPDDAAYSLHRPESFALPLLLSCRIIIQDERLITLPERLPVRRHAT
jgi:hypothetical protein